MTDKIAIRVRNLGKKYTIGGPQEPYHTFRDAMLKSLKAPLKMFHRAPPDKGLWALRDVSFDVEQGEVVGIIGRNGAGKSTLLKILSRITTPTEGIVEIHGRVGSLLEVGTGFHPEMTGRENIFLNGSILGMKKTEIEQKFDEIVKFTEIEKFIDTPVKRYSSGMYVRLAFAVAAHLDPEILVVDEVLAVGDAGFQKKCIGKMNAVAKEGRTILFVSHNMSAVNNLTKSCIVLQNGSIVYNGSTKDAIDFYLNSNFQRDNKSNFGKVTFERNSKKKAQFIELSVHDSKGVQTGQIFYHDDYEIRMRINILVPTFGLYTGFIIESSRHGGIMQVTDDDTKEPFLSGLPKGTYEYKFKMPRKLLPPGKYWIHVFIGAHIDLHFDASTFEIIDIESRRAMGNPPNDRGYYDYPVAPEITWDAIKISTEDSV